MSNSTIVQIAVYSRIVLWIFQVVVGVLPDHEASRQDVYLEEKRYPDHHPLVQFLFGGFGNWDSEYFLMISEHGYIYEQSLAFFPFLPAVIHTVSSGVTSLVGNPLNFPIRSLHLIVGWIVNNFVAFPLAVLFLYELTRQLHGNTKMAAVAALLFVINPANVFMCSLYTESFFSAFMFGGMFAIGCGKSWVGMVMFMMGGATRSNGILALIFIAIFHYHRLVSTCFNRTAVFIIVSCIIQCTCIVLPFILFQLYGYSLYCHMEDYGVGNKMADSLLSYLPMSSKSSSPSIPPEWCSHFLPFSYSHIQSKYWNVGFLKYYQIKQIPNFLLATPIVILSGISLVGFYTLCRPHWKQLLFPSTQTGSTTKVWTLLPYYLHLAVMLTFGVFTMHVQVLTRFIAASTPVIYWFAAQQIVPLLFNDTGKTPTTSSDKTLTTGNAVTMDPLPKNNGKKPAISYESDQSLTTSKASSEQSFGSDSRKNRNASNSTEASTGGKNSHDPATRNDGDRITLYTLFHAVFVRHHSTEKRTILLFCRMVLLFFVSYNVLGFVIHCNFYPWT